MSELSKDILVRTLPCALKHTRPCSGHLRKRWNGHNLVVVYMRIRGVVCGGPNAAGHNAAGPEVRESHGLGQGLGHKDPRDLSRL